MPGSGSLKETHIFTPPKAMTSSCTPQLKESRPPTAAGIEQEKCSAGIVINENVVKKEYRDVVYEPEKVRGPIKSDVDDFSEFQSMEPAPVATEKPTVIGLPLVGQILEPTKASNSVVINWPEPGQLNNMPDLDDFSGFGIPTPTATQAAEPAVETGAVAEETPNSKELSVTKEYSKPEIGVSPSDYMFSTSLQPKPIATTAAAPDDDFDDEFTDYQSIPPPTQEISPPSIAHMPDIVPATQNQTAKFILPLPEKAHYVEPTPPQPPAAKDQWQYVNGNQSTPVPPMYPAMNVMAVMSSIPMVPLQPEVKSVPSRLQEPSINWPDPGIDPDEMARLEALFPQPKAIQQPNASINNTKIESASAPAVASPTASADDEWSDFVSVTQPQLPITNILSQNLQKQQNDDDDWSDFVSVTGPAPTATWVTSASPNFPAWNTPTPPSASSPFGGAPSIFQSTTNQVQIPPPSFMSTPDFVGLNSAQIHSNGITNTFNHTNFKSKTSNGKIPLRPLPNHTTPSIISMPDLSFVAPKTLVNMPRNNFTKK